MKLVLVTRLETSSSYKFKIVETDASDIGYGGILKQRVSPESSEQIVRCFRIPP